MIILDWLGWALLRLFILGGAAMYYLGYWQFYRQMVENWTQ